MRSIIKTKQPTVNAWQLGTDTPMEQKLIREGRIIRRSADQYELFSQEALGATGESARAGDYFKVDSAGFPYPNSKAHFEANHRLLEGDTYLQIPQKLQAWFLGDPENEVIRYLQQHKGLQILPEQPKTCFRAPLWGSILTAASDAVLVIYHIERDASGQICDVDFNFVERNEFEKTYHLL